MIANSLTDDELPAFLADLGIPGLFDVHVHFMAPPVLAKVRDLDEIAGQQHQTILHSCMSGVFPSHLQHFRPVQRRDGRLGVLLRH